MRSTTSTCTIFFSRPTPAKLRDVLHCGCARTARGAPTSEVKLLHGLDKAKNDVLVYMNINVFLDLRWVNVQNAEEASKVLRVGNKNRSAAATKMNQSSSRRLNISLVCQIDFRAEIMVVFKVVTLQVALHVLKKPNTIFLMTGNISIGSVDVL